MNRKLIEKFALVNASNATPPPAQGYVVGSARDHLIWDKLWAECAKIGVDPIKALAQLFTPEMMEKIKDGEIIAAKTALEIIKSVEGQKVTVDGNISYEDQLQGLPETARIFEDFEQRRKASSSKGSGKE